MNLLRKGKKNNLTTTKKEQPVSALMSAIGNWKNVEHTTINNLTTLLIMQYGFLKRF